MNNVFKRASLILSMMVTLLGSSFAQEAEESEKKWTGSVGGDFVSHYVWRGQDAGGVSLQPSLGIEWRGLSIGAWGSYSFDKDDAKEIDLTIGYGIKGFSISVTDYWFAYPDVRNKYFNYKKGETAHVWEGQVGYDWGFLAFNWYTNFAGADGVNKNGKKAYSSYFNLICPFDWVKLNWEAEIGFIPYNTTFYADAEHFTCSNVSIKATKVINCKDVYSFGIFTQAIWNPASNSAYLVFGMNF